MLSPSSLLSVYMLENSLRASKMKAFHPWLVFQTVQCSVMVQAAVVTDWCMFFPSGSLYVAKHRHCWDHSGQKTWLDLAAAETAPVCTRRRRPLPYTLNLRQHVKECRRDTLEASGISVLVRLWTFLPYCQPTDRDHISLALSLLEDYVVCHFSLFILTATQFLIPFPLFNLCGKTKYSLTMA